MFCIRDHEISENRLVFVQGRKQKKKEKKKKQANYEKIEGKAIGQTMIYTQKQFTGKPGMVQNEMKQ